MRSNSDATPETISKPPFSLKRENYLRIFTCKKNLSQRIDPESLKIYELEEIHHKTQTIVERPLPLFPRASGRGASPFFSLFAPRIVQWSDNARGRSAGGQFVWMDNDTGRPRTMAASAVRGINQFRENARRWHVALKREKRRRAAVFAVHARSPPPRFFEIGRGGKNTVHTSTSFEKEYFESVGKNRVFLSLMLLGCWGVVFSREELFRWIVLTYLRQISKIIVSSYFVFLRTAG